jgi:hypothetical protein
MIDVAVIEPDRGEPERRMVGDGRVSLSLKLCRWRFDHGPGV